MDAEETKRFKAKQLRYKKAIAADMNIDSIKEKLWEIQGECADVQWCFEDDDNSLLNALCGDEEDEWEFKMMFTDLSAECEQMLDDLDEEWIPDCFDTFFCVVSRGSLAGWDTYEGDYFGLSGSYEEEMAREESSKRLMHMTKKDLLEAAQRCFRIAQMYMGLMHRYDCLKGALDILRDENTGYLQMVQQINQKYEAAEKDQFRGWHENVKEFNNLLDEMPQVAWLY